jgi:hypothetical protein
MCGCVLSFFLFSCCFLAQIEKQRKISYWGPNPVVGALINQWICGRLMDCHFLAAGKK